MTSTVISAGSSMRAGGSGGFGSGAGDWATGKRKIKRVPLHRLGFTKHETVQEGDQTAMEIQVEVK